MTKTRIGFLWGALAAFVALALSATSASAATPPRGSYTNSCWGATADQGTLRAFCRRNDGSFRLTFLPNYQDCRGDIRNSNGRLECSRRGMNLPSGDWYVSCRNYRLEGPFLRAECRNRVGVWRFTEINYRQCAGDIRNVNGRLICDVDYEDLPRGDWIRSCRNFSLDGNLLRAECRDNQGRYRYTQLNIRNCRDDVSNRNGTLVCGRGNDDDLPPGNWRSSCRDYYVDNRVLYAECRTTRNTWRDTSIDLRNCRRPISNENGNLTCGSGGNLPSGNWRDRCRNYSMDGWTLEAECQDREGKWHFSELDTRNCDSGVTTRGGRLACEGGGGGSEPELVRCESSDNRYKVCPIRQGAEVDLQQQLSLSPCIRDNTWGVNREGIWVDDGCRAIFRVEDRRY
jgi:hypothetical protein